MFYSSDVLVDKLLSVLSQPENCKNEYFMKPDFQEQIIPQAHFIAWDPQNVFFFFCIKSALHLNVNTVFGQRRVCVLCSTPRSQQTWTVPTTVGQSAGESPNTPVCRSTWASTTRAVSAVYLTMRRPRTPALKWVQCQRENTENYWTISNVDNGCQMLAWLLTCSAPNSEYVRFFQVKLKDETWRVMYSILWNKRRLAADMWLKSFCPSLK